MQDELQISFKLLAQLADCKKGGREGPSRPDESDSPTVHFELVRKFNRYLCTVHWPEYLVWGYHKKKTKKDTYMIFIAVI